MVDFTFMVGLLSLYPYKCHLPAIDGERYCELGVGGGPGGFRSRYSEAQRTEAHCCRGLGLLIFLFVKHYSL